MGTPNKGKSEERLWYVKLQGKSVGPMPKSRVKELIRDGKVQPHTEIRPSGAKTWKRVTDAKGFIGKAKKKRKRKGNGQTKTVAELLIEDARRKQASHENFINLLILLSPIPVGLYTNYVFGTIPSSVAFGLNSFGIGAVGTAMFAYPILLYRIGVSFLWRIISFIGYRGGGYDSSRTVEDTISKPPAERSKPLFDKLGEPRYKVLPEQTACSCCRYDQVSPSSGIIVVRMTKKVDLSHKSSQLTTTNALEPICRECGDELKRRTMYGIKMIPIALVIGVCVTACGHLIATRSTWDIGDPRLFYCVFSLIVATPVFLTLLHLAPSKRHMSPFFDENEVGTIMLENGVITEESKIPLKRSPDYLRLLEDGFTPTFSFQFFSGFYVHQLSKREVNASERSSIPLEAWLLDEAGLQKRFGISKGTQIAKKKAFYLEKWQGKEA